MSSLSEAARGALEALMQRGTYEYQSEFARKYVAQGREEGLQKGREEGREKGREEGREKGREEGLYEGERMALLEVLDARGLKVKEEARQRILACLEQTQLKRWLRMAVSVRTTEELFEPEPAARPTARKAGKRGPNLKAPKPRSKRGGVR